MKISIVEKVFFTKNFATLLKAGVPLNDALETVIDQSSGELKKILQQVEKDVRNGQGLAKSMSNFPKVFDGFYVSLISAGEESGNLENNLSFLADQLNKDHVLRQKVQGAMMYPGLVLGSTAIMGTGIAWFVLPKLIDLFNSFEVDLPYSTKILMRIAIFMRDYGTYVVLSMIAFVMGTYLFFQLRSVKKLWHSLVIDFPVLGRIAKTGELSRFSRNLGVLLKSGLPTLTAFDITIKTLSNLKFVDDLKEIREKIKSGKSIYESMSRDKYNEFDKLTRRMVDVGERSGNLEEMLIYLSDYYDGEIDAASKNLSTLLEPVLLLVIGLVVGFVAMAIISPIYSLVGGIG
jgi:type II secretory pathway component PulF